VANCSSSAFADQSIGFQEYFKEGVKAFKEHDDQEALRCFKIAQIYDPSDVEVNRYISILEEKAANVDLASSSQTLPKESIGYRYYLEAGINAYQAHDNIKAIHYFNLAIVFNPDSKEVDQYLQDLSQSTSISPSPITVSEQGERGHLPLTEIASAKEQQPRNDLSPSPTPAVVVPQNTIYVAPQKPKKPPEVISLSQILNNPGQSKPRLQINLNSSVILEGKNIQRFLIVDEGYIGVKAIGLDELELDALRVGTTFLHLWDDTGRHTFYVEVIFPKIVNPNGVDPEMNGVYHSSPFTATYSNDWSTYYTGKNVKSLRRQSYELDQSLAVKGETPYGNFDTSGSYTDFNAISKFDTYTIGLSQIPLEGASNFNLRGFDAERYLSPLTMPGTTIRGVFADVNLLDNNLGLSLSHGQEQKPIGFISTGANQFDNSYIDAARLTLFPKSDKDQYSFNFATGYGSDRQSYLGNHVYSVEGQHKFNDFLTLNAEEGSDTNHESSLAALRWQDGTFKTGLNFRDIDKNYSTISTLPAYQGETGGAWTTDGEFKNFTENTFVEAYQDHLDSNPNNPNALNYDANGHLRANITQDLWSDTDFNFMDTQGELSPQRSLGVNQRLSKSFGIWNSLRGTIFGGGGYQNSHSSGSNISDYGREDVTTGIQLPLTRQITSYVNYEYDWLNQPISAGGISHPSVINTGLSYQKQLTTKLSFNSQLDFHDELGVRAGNNSFLSGEQSVIITTGFNYNPSPDVNIFADGNASQVLSHIGSPAYDDFEVHVGVRITLGGATYWDPLGTVSGIVFKDKIGDGKYVSGDEGIPGVKVKVGDKMATTDKDGRYHIQVRARGVDVMPVLDSIPGGLIFSTPQKINLQIKQGRMSKSDFGLISQTGIYGIVFVSRNGTNTPSEGDQFIGKVKIILDGHEIQKSDSHGEFYFRKVSAGTHTISIDINSMAINMVPQVKLKNTIDVAEGSNFDFNIPVEIKKADNEDN